MPIALDWGSTAAERGMHFPCDDLLPDAEMILFRAVDCRASAPTVFRWLCQLRIAPYSYDWIDNLGRRSPRHLTPGLEEMAEGQRMMTIFRLVSYERDRHLTILMDSPKAVRRFGQVAVSYLILPGRLVAKLRVRGLGPIRRRLLAWGDLIMMRKQLLTLKKLAEDPGQAIQPSARVPR